MCGTVCLSDVVVGCLWLGVLCVWVGKPLFSMMAWMVLISSLYSFLCRYLIAVYLFWAGWLEE